MPGRPGARQYRFFEKIVGNSIDFVRRGVRGRAAGAAGNRPGVPQNEPGALGTQKPCVSRCFCVKIAFIPAFWHVRRAKTRVSRGFPRQIAPKRGSERDRNRPVAPKRGSERDFHVPIAAQPKSERDGDRPVAPTRGSGRDFSAKSRQNAGVNAIGTGRSRQNARVNAIFRPNRARTRE